MAYKTSCGLYVADEEVYKILKKNIKIKNVFVEKNMNTCSETMEYSQVVHSLDLLQYLVVQEKPQFSLVYKMSLINEKFDIAKIILNKYVIEDIQYCINILQEYIDAWSVINNIRKNVNINN